MSEFELRYRFKCSRCYNSHYRGSIFICLQCPSYEECEKCFYSEVTHGHPMQCHIHMNDYDHFYKGEKVSVCYPSSLTCPFCSKPGHIPKTLWKHMNEPHLDYDGVSQRHCPMCSVFPRLVINMFDITQMKWHLESHILTLHPEEYSYPLLQKGTNNDEGGVSIVEMQPNQSEDSTRDESNQSGQEDWDIYLEHPMSWVQSGRTSNLASNREPTRPHTELQIIENIATVSSLALRERSAPRYQSNLHSHYRNDFPLLRRRIEASDGPTGVSSMASEFISELMMSMLNLTPSSLREITDSHSTEGIPLNTFTEQPRHSVQLSGQDLSNDQSSSHDKTSSDDEVSSNDETSDDDEASGHNETSSNDETSSDHGASSHDEA